MGLTVDKQYNKLKVNIQNDKIYREKWIGNR